MICPCKVQKQLLESDYIYDPLKECYLDYNATTPPDRELLSLYQNSVIKYWAHEKSPHGPGSQSYQLHNRVIRSLRKSFNDPEGEFLFYPSGSWALEGALDLLSQWAGRENISIMYSSQCHPSVLNALEHLQLQSQSLEVDSQGHLLLPSSWPGNKKPLLIYSVVNHETGGLERPKELYRQIHERGGWVMADGIQAFPRCPESFWLPYTDLFVISGHKFHVPKGIALLSGGLLKKMEKQQLDHQILGTQDIALQYVLSKGVEKTIDQRDTINKQLKLQEKEALHYWKKMGLDFHVLSPENKVPGVINISLRDRVDMEELFLYLASRFISISRFCACKGSVKGASDILLAQGISQDEAEQSLRISGGKYNSREDWLKLGRELVRYLNSKTHVKNNR